MWREFNRRAVYRRYCYRAYCPGRRLGRGLYSKQRLGFETVNSVFERVPILITTDGRFCQCLAPFCVGRELHGRPGHRLYRNRSEHASHNARRSRYVE